MPVNRRIVLASRPTEHARVENFRLEEAAVPPLAPGAEDLNVRNAPAPLIGNRTPLPQSLSPVLLKAWVIDKDGKTLPAPDYTVRILGPTDGVKERQVLATLTVKPVDAWFRPKPNDPAPTAEVKLK